MFSIHFLISNLFLALLCGIFLCLKRILKRYLTIPAQYHLWYPFLLLLSLPFLPFSFWNMRTLFPQFLNIWSKTQDFSSGDSARQLVSSASSVSSKIYDYAVSLNHNSYAIANKIFLIVWMIGVLVMSLYFLSSRANLYLLQKRACQITAEEEPELYSFYLSCFTKLNIHRKIPLYTSCQITTPVSYGILRPKVLIPQDMDLLLSNEELYYIFLHELHHYKHKDAIFNTLVCIFQALYWFHPLLWTAFRQFPKDRELACDYYVMHTIGAENAARYASTLIHYIEKISHRSQFSSLSTFSGEKNLIVTRIREIINYQKPSLVKQWQSKGSFLLIMALFLCSSPFFTTSAVAHADDSYTDEQIEELHLQSYFKKGSGSFILYDMQTDSYQIYNKTASIKRISPDSTYKIYSALFALEETLITPEASQQTWNGSPQAFAAWEKDQTLKSAMQQSVNWYFQNLDARLGRAKLSSYYKKISYGNYDLTGSIDSYWGESSLKISPIEQVNLLSDLLNNRWHFQKQNIAAIKNSIFLQEKDHRKLYGKTGTGIKNGKTCNGWFIGFVETGKKTYCFAANLQNSKDACGSQAAKITLSILKDMRIFE